MEPACSWRVLSHVPWAGGGWGAVTHASRGPGPLGELRGKGRGGLCLKHIGIASGVGLHLVELVGVDPR